MILLFVVVHLQAEELNLQVGEVTMISASGISMEIVISLGILSSWMGTVILSVVDWLMILLLRSMVGESYCGWNARFSEISYWRNT